MYNLVPNTAPTRDGDLTVYEDPIAKASTQWYDKTREVVFVNGMLNSADDHLKAASALSLLQMCKVVGIYNGSSVDSGFFRTARAVVEDLGQCLTDKIRWDGGLNDRPLAQVSTWILKEAGQRQAAIKLLRIWLKGNEAAVTLFDHIISKNGQPITIFCHSQGNLVTSNALTAAAILDPALMKTITVYSYASPSVFWPSGFKHHSYAYTIDIVPLLAGLGNSLRFGTSTIGFNVSHGFEQYRNDDATFVVNSFRWGIRNVTLSMDEDGLASALADMGRNMQRITRIFERIYDGHESDRDEIAMLYVEKIKGRSEIISRVRKHAPLTTVLIKCLEKGWTTDREQKAIDLIS